jgi:hypothetical protein
VKDSALAYARIVSANAVETGIELAGPVVPSSAAPETVEAGP